MNWYLAESPFTLNRSLPEPASRSVVVTPPATEPVTIHEAKRHCEIASTNTDHDVLLFSHIVAAREQWERDTGMAFISRTMQLVTPKLYDKLQFAERPVTAITSIRYYPSTTIATLSNDVYALDVANSMIRLKYGQNWPAVLDRWDAWEINYTAGSHTDSTTVPAIAKQAMLLYVGYLFRGNRGDDDRPNDLRAYEALVHRHMRSTYP